MQTLFEELMVLFDAGSQSYLKTLGPDAFHISEWRIFSIDVIIFK